MERVALTDELTLAAVLSRVEAGGWVILTRDGAELAAVVRPGDLSVAAVSHLLEALADPRPATPDGRPQSPPAADPRINGPEQLVEGYTPGHEHPHPTPEV
ncbi:MAG: hypothetical protein ACK4WH_13190 [Phycisphaerales bacterium]